MRDRSGHRVAGRTRWWVLLALVVALALLSLAVGSSWTPLTRLDARAASAAFDSTAGHDGRIAFWTFVTNYGGPMPMRALLVLAALVALVRRRVAVSVGLVVLAFVEWLVLPLAKSVLDRPRPTWSDPIIVAASSSYPSGHATAAAAAAVAVALVVRRTVVSCACLLGAVGVAASRVFLGVHYLSDVCGGLLLGALLALATHLATTALTDRRSTVTAGGP